MFSNKSSVVKPKPSVYFPVTLNLEIRGGLAGVKAFTKTT